MSIPFRTIAAGTPSSVSDLGKHYLTQTLSPEDVVLATYYERTDGLGVLRPDMAPVAVMGLGVTLGQKMSPDQINALIAGRRADGELIAGKTYAPERKLAVNPNDRVQRYSTAIGSTDFTVSPGKSVQVAHAFAPPAEAAAIFEAHIEAARFAVGMIAKERGTIRLGDGGMKGTLPAEVGWIEFTHRTERKSAGEKSGLPADPGLHTHFVMMAATFGADGKVGSFDTGQLEGTTMAADAAYHARLAQNLRDRGFEAELDPATGACEMPIISKPVRTLFSKRSTFGEDLARAYTEDRGERWNDLSDEQRTARIKAATQSKDQKIFAKEDGIAESKNWRHQARETCGWEAPPSLQQNSPPPDTPTREEKDRVALEVARDYLAAQFEARSVIPDWQLNVAAGRGWVKAGLTEAADIERVVALMRTEGVRHNGEATHLLFAEEPGRRFTSVTTEKHESDEREFVRLVSAASKDITARIPPELLDRKLAESGMDFSDDHGKAQLAGIKKLAEGARFGMWIAASGAGKSAAVSPLRAAWEEMGFTTYGSSLGSRQSDALADTGIRPDRLIASSVLLDRIAEGTVRLDRRSVVFVDEVSQLGTQSGVRLMRASEKLGFTVIPIGDNVQISSLEAGNFIALAERGMGPAPRVETTRRQKTTREQEISGLMRRGKAADALDMKREDGTALMIPGSRGDVIDAIASLYAARLVATGRSPSISAPTNQDAHDISSAVRRERRAMGLVGQDLTKLAATDGVRSYELPLAVGDHVRLFRNTRAAGTGRGGSIGRNQSVLEVVGVERHGITMKTAKGRVALVHLSDLTDKASGRILLAYGTALTGHSGQGITSSEHISATPSGSRGVDGKALYSMGTRHTQRTYYVTSDESEMRAVRAGRPINDPHAITLEDKWANVALAFANQREKDTALALFDRAGIGRRGATTGLGAATPPARPKPERAPQPVPTKRTAVQVNRLIGPERRQQAEQARREKRSMRSAAERPKQQTSSPPPAERTKRPKVRPETSAADARAEFGEALRASGFRLRGNPEMDGQWHRAQVEGDRGRKMSGRYRGYLDGRPAGFIENYRAGIAQPWKSDGPVPVMTEADHRQRDTARMARESERHAAETAAAMRAVAMWTSSKPVLIQHPYLTRKDILSHGARETASGSLVVPLRDTEGVIRNVQTIRPDGEKRFVKNGRKDGLYAQIGTIDPTKPLLIAEGFATAATLHEATGLPVVVAFDAGNLEPVARSIRAKHPELPMVFAADNDHHLPRRENPLPNIGMDKADIAAKAVGGVVVAPSFGDIEKQPVVSGKTPPTDWNDYAAINGKDKLRQIVQEQMKSKGIVMTDKAKVRKDAPKLTHAEREAARQSIAGNEAQSETARQQQALQQQQRLTHNRGPRI